MIHPTAVMTETRPSGRGRSRPGAGAVVVALFACAVFVLGATWAISTPAPSGTDEPAHYIRALAVARGELTGPHALFPFRDPLHPDAVYFWDQTTRAFQLPARIAPAATFACTEGDPSLPATCVSGSRCKRWAAACTVDPPTTGTVTVVSYLGVYEPTAYVLPGLLAQLANNDVNGLRFARMGSVLLMTALIALTVALLWERRRAAYSLLGLIVATTPMLVSINGVLNANGAEIVSSLTFTAALVRLWRDREAAPRWVWVAAGISGSVCAFSRFLGPLWIVIDTLTVVAILGVRPTLGIVRKGGRAAAFALAATGSGLLADLIWWQVVVGLPHARRPLSFFTDNITTQTGYLQTVLQQEIGRFGWGDTGMGSVGYIIWGSMALALLSLAFVVGTPRQRLILGASAGASLVFAVVAGSITTVAWDFEGPGILGRYLLPWSVGIALVAGEIVCANVHRLRDLAPRNLVLYFVAAAAACHAIALWMVARRFAVGVNGPLMFLGKSAWRPPLGWGPWIVTGLVGCGLLVAAGTVARRAQAREPAGGIV